MMMNLTTRRRSPCLFRCRAWMDRPCPRVTTSRLSLSTRRRCGCTQTGAAQDDCAFALFFTLFFISATFDSNSEQKNSGANGNGCAKSPETLPHLTANDSKSSSLQTIPENFEPVATICAPVKVAMSIKCVAFKVFDAYELRPIDLRRRCCSIQPSYQRKM